VAKSILPRSVIDWVRRRRQCELVPGPLTYNQDGLATCHNCDFRSNPLFAESYRLGKSTGSWGNNDPDWRAYVACWAAHKAVGLEGDFVECGVNRGGLARTVIHFVGFDALPKTFYLLDTFCGLVDDYLTAEERRVGVAAMEYSECYDAVRQTFQQFPNVQLVRGPVPDTLCQVRAEKVSFLSIDMNCVAPEIAAAEFFWDKLVSGAVMLLDDYGSGSTRHIAQKHGFDAFAAKHGVLVLPLPTGQGLIVKP
jgi:hypothetical protein